MKRIRKLRSLALVWIFCAASTFTALAEEKADPFDVAVKEGREFFKQKLYVEALDRFALALTLKPENRDAAFLAGLSAYWARNPMRALEFWNELLDTGKRNSAEEFKLETHRVMALNAMKQREAADTVVDRIYELRRKLPSLKSVDGYVREHIFLKDPTGQGKTPKTLRIGCWEVFDERNEAQHVWSFPVVVQSEKDEPLVRRFVVEAATLPGGEAGYVFVEEAAGGRRVYKRWLQRPAYNEVRVLLLQVMFGKAQPLDAAGGDSKKTSSPNAQNPSIAQERVFTENEQLLAARVKTLGGDPATIQILTVAARLRETDFDVTKLTRLSLSDPELAQRYLEELKTKTPYAQEDAAELVDLISKSKVEIVTEFFVKLNKLGARQTYLDYSLLTGLNTRNGDLPPEFLRECLKSQDLMVRQTAALMLARGGDKRALGQLFKEVESADAPICAVLYDALNELVGKELAAPPPDGAGEAGLKKWKHETARWWQQHEKKLNVVQDRSASDPYWK